MLYIFYVIDVTTEKHRGSRWYICNNIRKDNKRASGKSYLVILLHRISANPIFVLLEKLRLKGLLADWT